MDQNQIERIHTLRIRQDSLYFLAINMIYFMSKADFLRRNVHFVKTKRKKKRKNAYERKRRERNGGERLRDCMQNDTALGLMFVCRVQLYNLV